jgi:hypothetical protein
MTDGVSPRRRQQFIFVPTARQALAIRTLTAGRQAVDEHVSQGAVIRELVEFGLVEKARCYVNDMPPAVAGNGGHAATFLVAQMLVRDFALADADALRLLREYNQRCQPPWSEEELRRKLGEAKVAGVSL